MELPIFFHAVVVAILHSVALADGPHDVFGVAPFAVADGHLLSFLVLESKQVTRLFPKLSNDNLVVIQ